MLLITASKSRPISTATTPSPAMAAPPTAAPATRAFPMKPPSWFILPWALSTAPSTCRKKLPVLATTSTPICSTEPGPRKLMLETARDPLGLLDDPGGGAHEGRQVVDGEGVGDRVQHILEGRVAHGLLVLAEESG